MLEGVPIPVDIKSTRLIDRYRIFIRNEGKTYATEKTYVYWIVYFIRHHDLRHPEELGAMEVESFLNYLSHDLNVAPNTQGLALNALTHFYNHFLKIPVENIQFSYAKKKLRIPTVFTHNEAMSVIKALEAPYQLIAKIQYGSGLRISEAIRLRINDIDFGNKFITVRNGKGLKDRTSLLPEALVDDLKQQIQISRVLFESDLDNNQANVWVPYALSKKYPNIHRSLGWQYLFPAARLSIDPRANQLRRHHIHSTSVQRAIYTALKECKIHRKASSHTFRHTFATQLLRARYDLKQIQKLMGHSDIRTTEIYLHVVENLGGHVKSPLDEQTF